ncbi:hypothetical protein [Niallia sp. Krafla_26]|uniref:hypothetical protein n=1 Tax=Niallia sp. Krafla_26 TaxID=3064703 RepID=UPI003D163C72
MPRKSADSEEENQQMSSKEEVEQVNSMLASVLMYLSDESVEEIDLEYLLNNTEGLREWWDQYREKNRKQIEEEIKNSLEKLPLEELENIREKIKENIQ